LRSLIPPSQHSQARPRGVTLENHPITLRQTRHQLANRPLTSGDRSAPSEGSGHRGGRDPARATCPANSCHPRTRRRTGRKHPEGANRRRPARQRSSPGICRPSARYRSVRSWLRRTRSSLSSPRSAQAGSALASRPGLARGRPDDNPQAGLLSRGAVASSQRAPPRRRASRGRQHARRAAQAGAAARAPARPRPRRSARTPTSTRWTGTTTPSTPRPWNQRRPSRPPAAGPGPHHRGSSSPTARDHAQRAWICPAILAFNQALDLTTDINLHGWELPAVPRKRSSSPDPTSAASSTGPSPATTSPSA
jgi:hypothetical protein